MDIKAIIAAERRFDKRQRMAVSEQLAQQLPHGAPSSGRVWLYLPAQQLGAVPQRKRRIGMPRAVASFAVITSKIFT